MERFSKKVFFLYGPIESERQRTRFFRYHDEDGKSLIDYDDIQSDLEPHHDNVLLDDYEDKGDDDDWRRRQRSQTLVYHNDSSTLKFRNRLIKKGDTER
ncbi:hypothetical protein AHAS_Ahas18G0263300 [Arachis hypogaea]